MKKKHLESLVARGMDSPPRTRRKPDLRPESLEDRWLMTMTHTAFARTLGLITSPGGSEVKTLSFRSNDFVNPSGRPVLLSLSAEPNGANTFTPTLRLVGVDTRGVRTSITPTSVFTEANKYVNNLFTLPQDNFVLEMTTGAQGSGQGSYQLQLGLAGDINGDRRVDSRDSNMMQTALQRGRSSEFLTVESVFDVNRDHFINQTDLDIITQNQGASTGLQPLVVRTDHDHSTSRLVQGQTDPFAMVQVDLDRNGQFDQSTTASSTGAFSFNLPAGLDGRTVLFEAKNFQGQAARVEHLLPQAQATPPTLDDTTPPALTIHTPTNQTITNRNILVQGFSQDNSGVLPTLIARIDQGPTINLTPFSDGSFRFETPLPLDGSADGSHRIQILAKDAFDNVRIVELNMTLDTTAPTNLNFGAGAIGSSSTTQNLVEILGQTEPGAYVRLVNQGAGALADAQGMFRFSNVALVNGANSVTIVAEDLVGNARSVTKVITKTTTTTLAPQESNATAAQTTTANLIPAKASVVTRPTRRKRYKV